MKNIIKKTKKFVGEHKELIIGIGMLTGVFLGGMYVGKCMWFAKLSKLVDGLGKDQFCNMVKQSAFSNKSKSFVLVNREIGNMLLHEGIFEGKMRKF